MRKYNKILGILFLVIVICLNLTGCTDIVQKKGDKIQEEISYQAEEIFLDKDLSFIENVCLVNDRIYMLGMKNGKGNTLLSCHTDGSDILLTVIPIDSGEFVQCFYVDNQGYIQVLTNQYQDKQYQYHLKTIDIDGEIISSYMLSMEKSDSQKVSYANFISSTGNIYIDTDKKILQFSPDGKLISKSRCNYEVKEFVETEDKTVYASVEITEQKSGLIKLEEGQKRIEQSLGFGEYSFRKLQLTTKQETGMYCNDKVSLYQIELPKKEGEADILDITPLFNWIELGINGNDVAGIVPFKDGFATITWQKEGVKLILIKQSKQSATKKKITLKLACAYLNEYIRQEIMEFQKENEDYKIEVWDYSMYENAEERLQLDMAAGRIPDIISLNHFSIQNLIQKGILTDLYPLIEEDKEMEKETFIPEVLETLEQNGKLYSLITDFYIHCLSGSKEKLGDREGISVEEIMDIYKNLSENEKLFYSDTQQYAFDILCHISDFVDPDSNKIDFNCQDFIDLLKFSKQFPEKEKELKPGTMMIQTPLICYQSFGSLRSLMEQHCFYENQGGAVFLSYPSKDKKQELSIIGVENELGITEYCQNKTKAWEFVRRFFTYKYQMNYTYDGKDGSTQGFPVRQDVFDKQLEYAMAKEDYIDEDGTNVMSLENVPSRQGNNENIILHAFTKEEISQVKKLFKRCHGLTFTDTTNDISKLIKEELPAFFAGDRTAKETAEIIQKRVELYINERK